MRSPQVQTPFVTRTLLRASATMLTAAVIGVLGWAGPATADHVMPPNIPSESEARTQLNALTVRAKGPQDGYDRSLFPHWNVVDSPCTARQVVLERDGHDVVTDDNCQPTAGSWWRSEERRVGKERRRGWAPTQPKKNTGAARDGSTVGGCREQHK